MLGQLAGALNPEEQFAAQHPMLAAGQQFAQTKPGQQALLAFANAALQAKMNPTMPQGVGLLNALSHGMLGYGKGQEREDEKAWIKESRQMQRDEFGMGKERMELSRKADKRAEESHKREMESEDKVELYRPDGSSVVARSSEEAKLYMEKGFSPVKPAPHRGTGANKPTAMELSLIAAGVYPGEQYGLTPQEAQKGLETYKKIFGAQNLLQMLLGGAVGGGAPGEQADPNDMSGKSDDELKRIAGGK